MIRILEDLVVNQIAAGEVVERPASVVKELLENSIDAGARQIRVELRAGGAELIRIRDDGVGMSRTDASMCLERHATSKIRSAEDLIGVRSLGFRGEAVPSIAAVSRLEILTRLEDEEVGTRVRVEGGRLERVEAAGGPKGTRVTVKDLFFNVPARRKFLRKTQTELGHCTETVVRQLLNHPEVDLELSHGGRRLIRAPAHDSLNARSAAMLGATGRQLIPVEFEKGGVRISGLVSPVGVHRGTPRGSSYLYVNGRYVQDSLLRRAIAEAYRGLVPRGRHPVVVLRVDMPGADVDVNVHPAKTEVRFRQARVLSAMVAEGLRAALGGQGLLAGPPAPSRAINPRTESAQGRLGIGGESRFQRPQAPEPPVARPHGSEGTLSPAWLPPPPPVRPAPAGSEAPPRGFAFLGQLDSRTFLCRRDGDLWMVDRFRLETLRARACLEVEPADSRPLLAPLILELPRPQYERLLALAPHLSRLGLELGDFGEGSVLIKSQPSVLSGVGLEALLMDISGTRQGEHDPARLLDGLAAAAAAVACRPLSSFELSERLQEVLGENWARLEEMGACFPASEIDARLRRFRSKDQ